MTTDNNATYYDLDLNGTTIETRDIVRAVLERAGLGADASHQLGKLLERCIRLGAKPGTDVGREVEKIHIEAGMLRDAANPDEHRGLTADDARKWRGLRARIAELESDLGTWKRAADYWHNNYNNLRPKAVAAERERDEARETLSRHASAYKRHITTLARDRDAYCELHAKVRGELNVMTDRYRPRRQSEEPAPDNIYVLAWFPGQGKLQATWYWILGQHVPQDAYWTHQPRRPRADTEREAKR